LWCHSESDEDHLTDSDEIYAIVTVTDDNGDSVTTRFPRRDDPAWYYDVDSGERRPKRDVISRIWGGNNGKAARDLAITVWVWEQDSGDPEERKQATDLVWKAAVVICGAVGEANPLVCVVAAAVAAVFEGVVAIVSGGEDDLVQEKTYYASADQMQSWVESGMRSWPREPISGHFRTIHNGSGNAEGADYHVYFSFHTPLPPE
jgi:hypothetical protein